MTQPDEPGTALARTEQQRIAVDLNDPLSDLDQAFRLATMLAQSSMVPQALRGSPQNCLITMLLGRELGLSWIQAIRGIYVLPSGQPGLRGALLLARIRAAGHRYDFVESEDSCEFVITRKDEEFKIKYTGRFTVQDAQAAGLVKRHDGKLVARSSSGQPLPWESYRKDMLQWRAVARGAARGCPELIFGFDLAGIGDGNDGSTVLAEVVPAPQPAPGVQDVRDKLAQLDRQHAAGTEHPPPPTEATEPKPATAGAAVPPGPPMTTTEPTSETAASADYEVSGSSRPNVETATTGETAGTVRAEPPGLPELHELLRRCGVSGPAQVRLCAVLAHRELSGMNELSKGEVFIIHDTVTRVAGGHASSGARRQALDRYLKTIEEPGQDADEET